MKARTLIKAIRFGLPLVLAGCLGTAIRADEELEQQATWSIPTPDAVRAQMHAFLESRKLNEVTRAKIQALWPATGGPASPDQLLDQVTTTFALVSVKAREVVEFCRQTTDVKSVAQFSILNDKKQPAFLRNNLRLLYGRWLSQHRFYDEALQQLEGLNTDDVVDPAALLFYQSTGLHRMPDKKQCLPIADRLLENEQQIPRRYATLAHLIREDLKPLKPDSLDEISRLMDEIRRRLDLQRAGTRVRQQEDDVIAKLDKLIKKLEDQQQSGAAGGSLAPSSPARDSVPMGGIGPGKVDPKHLGSKSGWGNLPPKQRQEALQQIGKDLPAHYREVIEEYFRRLAREGTGAGG